MKSYSISKNDREFARKHGIKLVYRIYNNLSFIVACRYGKKPTKNCWLLARDFCNKSAVKTIVKLQAKKT